MALALVSVAPLVSMRRSLFSSPYELKSIDKTIPNLVMCRKRMSGTPSIRVSSTTSASNDDGVRRRVGDYRYNHWDDDLIDSLATSYEAPSYLERADTLVEAIKDRFNSMGVDDGERMSPLTDLYQRLWMVDSVERLGIDRHFQNEIKSALDYVFSYWKEKGIGRGRQSAVTDLNSTALGLRTLRLHGYPVSSDVLENFKDHNGQFTCSGIQTEGEIRGVLNLFRASLIAFPGEKVMEEAEIFSTMYLKHALQKIAVSSLSQEIEYLLEYGWHTNPPRLEARMYMEVFPQDTIYEQKLVELAKVEFNIFHSLQKRELQSLTRWWKHYGFPQLSFTRHIHVEYYTFGSCIATDPKQSAFRLCFAKMSYFVTVLDDIYDTYGTMEELELFTAAIKRWDPSVVDCLPEYMKGVYMAVYDTVNEMAKEAEKVQGRDTLNYVRQAWELYIDAYMPEAKWISSGYLPTFQEYLDNSKISFGTRITILQPILTLGEPLPHEILQEIDFPAKFNDLISVILRLKGDTRCYKADRARGEEASSVSCYMKDNAGITEEDAVHCINDMVNNLLKELNWELLKPDSNVPISCRKAAFDICRIFHHGYKYRDGYGDATIEVKNLVKRTVLEPVPL
uniref:(-)-beta-phellandrene synthase 1, chloroplastic n=1 Tax=Pinus contorta TaxID=3339 RepID=BPHL1_PINCO|nr:RecName: Full=(-)-beta-phellandrene synthase 1, chloroplastic; AltName: Full=Terpene synthase (-)betaphell1; Short=PcTPS-(-)betaphell1; Flags: Precursor [Pinus contorta]AFU73853.1 (-)-beta-phellandrene synthase [Pinus contorta]